MVLEDKDIKAHLYGDQTVVLGDQDVKAYLYRTTPKVKMHSVKSVKISYQAMCMMIMSILNNYLKSKLEIQRSSQYMKEKSELKLKL